MSFAWPWCMEKLVYGKRDLISVKRIEIISVNRDLICHERRVVLSLLARAHTHSLSLDASLCMCVRVRVHEYICKCICVYACMYACVCFCLYKQACMYVQNRVALQKPRPAVRGRTYVYKYELYTHMYICMYVQAAFQKPRTALCEDVCKKILCREPSNLKALYRLGCCQRDFGDIDRFTYTSEE